MANDLYLYSQSTQTTVNFS